MSAARVTLVVGTRPEAIKLAPVAHALAARGMSPRLLLTGQHPFLDPASYGLGGVESVRLGCTGVENPQVHVGLVALAAERHLDSTDLLIVQGDTSSALGGALAGSMAGVPVAHVEAGLRTHDLRSPWPEEEFRIAIDHQAELLFAPTELSAANLRREQVPGSIHVTGNTGIDALFAAAAGLPCRSRRLTGKRRLLVTCHRRESWGDGLNSIADALGQIACSGLAEIDFVLHPNPRVSDEMHRLLGARTGIALRRPCGHGEMLAAMQAADLILSDSGGMQEEAPVLGVPLLILREKTERPEALACGNMELVGTDSGRIFAAVERLLGDVAQLAAMARPRLPYGDGSAASRIADIVEQWLLERSCPETAARAEILESW